MLRFCPLLIVLSGLVVLGWWLPNRLHNPDKGSQITKFNSLSYAPFGPGESPLNNHFASAAEIDSDLALLAKISRGIRTYACNESPNNLAAMAQKHGLKLWEGIWLGTDRARNAAEMARAIQDAHTYPDTVERVVVGNEVLLRRDLPVDELIADIDDVRAHVKQPVAYADVSDFWDQFPQVAPHVDVVLVHLLPYWEDKPTGITHAVEMVGNTLRHFQAEFPHQQIAIGETGWPSRGRERGDALPSRLNEARFLRGFMALAATRHVDYNFIEAFDQDWKYEEEGIVGANWGLMTASRGLKIPPSGPLREDPYWKTHAEISIICGLILAALGVVGHRPNGAATKPQLALLGMTLGAALGFAQADVAPVLYDVHVWVAALVNLGGQALLAALAMLRASGAIAPAPWRTGADATRRVRALLRLQRPGWAGLFEDVFFLFLWTATLQQIMMVVNARDREFPISSFAVPLIVTAARLAQRDLPTSSGHREEALLATILTLCSCISFVMEGPLNGQSLRWNSCALILSIPLWASLWGRRSLREL